MLHCFWLLFIGLGIFHCISCFVCLSSSLFSLHAVLTDRAFIGVVIMMVVIVKWTIVYVIMDMMTMTMTITMYEYDSDYDYYGDDAHDNTGI